MKVGAWVQLKYCRNLRLTLINMLILAVIRMPKYPHLLETFLVYTNGPSIIFTLKEFSFGG